MPRSLVVRLFIIVFACLLQACGGDGDSDSSSSTSSVVVSRVDVVQTYSQESGTGYQRLVRGKPALLRVFVTGPANTPSPVVTARVSSSAGELGTLTLSGPASLSPAPDTNAADTSFNGLMPAAWMGPGLRVHVEARDAGNALLSTLDRSPVVGGTTGLKVVVVPLITGNGASGALVTGVPPSLAAIKAMLVGKYPLAEGNITVTQREAYRVTSATTIRTGADWNAALFELETLRKTEQSDLSVHYFGFVPLPNFSSGIVGYGYVNVTNANSGALRAAIGADTRTSFSLETMTHELGHNQSLEHAPACIDPITGDVDPNFPYRASPYIAGWVGPAPIYDASSLTPVVPAPVHDVMGYCDDGFFLSDYNYRKAQGFMETTTAASARGATAMAIADSLILSGSLDAGKVVLAPPVAVARAPEPGAEGSWTLRMETADGRVVDQAFTPVAVGDAPQAPQHFSLVVNNPGEIARIRVFRAGSELPVSTAEPAPTAIAAARGGASESSPEVRWSESGGQLVLSWDASRYPILSVQHQGATTRTLALQLRGGEASLPLAGTPAGGRWMFSLSRGLNAKRIEAVR